MVGNSIIFMKKTDKKKSKKRVILEHLTKRDILRFKKLRKSVDVRGEYTLFILLCSNLKFSCFV